MKPLGRVKIKWSPEFAYAIGLLVTDGSLSKDGRHICFTSKDEELINNFQRSLKINLHVGKKASGSVRKKKYYVVQIGDVQFYKFLLQIGLTPNKTKNIREIKVPKRYFFHFLRGHFDGDGTFYSYFDPRWRSSFMYYTALISASRHHIIWLQNLISDLLKIKGHITKSGSIYQLKYAKAESLKLLRKLYFNAKISLSRKLSKINNALSVEGCKIAQIGAGGETR